MFIHADDRHDDSRPDHPNGDGGATLQGPGVAVSWSRASLSPHKRKKGLLEADPLFRVSSLVAGTGFEPVTFRL
jgi:hypothetical protein